MDFSGAGIGVDESGTAMSCNDTVLAGTRAMERASSVMSKVSQKWL